MLAEVADLLPNVLQPDTSVNRVYLVAGKLYVIPIAESPADLTPLPSKATPTVSQAVHIARNFTQVNMVNQECQAQLQERLQKFEGNLEQLQHRTKCYIPWACVHALRRCPSLITAAVQAFHHHRDEHTTTTLSAMCKFPPESRVWARITMSRGQYALLRATNFAPSRIVGWNIPPANHADFKGYDLGMKLACGFEILAAQAQKEVSAPRLEENVQWQRYVASLEKRGYFQNFLPQSEPYNTLLQQANEFFLQHVDWKEGSRPAHAEKLLASLEEADGSVYEKEGKMDTLPDDDDSWLTLTPESLDELLAKQFNLQSSGNATALLPNLEDFLKYEAGAEGAEPRKPPRARKRSSQVQSRKISTLSNFSTVSEASTNIAFDPDSFGKALEGILDCHVPEDDFSDSDTGMSSYGEDEDEDELQSGSLNEYMKAMDQELANTDVKKIPPAPGKASSESSLDDVESFEPVNIDGAALGNLLAAYQAQRGRPGPASSLLSHLKENDGE